ncbi:Histone-lysine N-methyltransferase, H3 lysine-9 specific [Grifola frondosa]|uniref:Histone-lysine N-methyltransferase, H3 lysine-9 specific n=1 Tax=Grifola frondosa TaxID=5627 RepID=A0A1C7LTZ5_GRIFR|nr:Histone-lysine N-methyltransferase, H3 lysine-9 specific [Grifola frondosa]
MRPPPRKKAYRRAANEAGAAGRPSLVIPPGFGSSDDELNVSARKKKRRIVDPDRPRTSLAAASQPARIAHASASARLPSATQPSLPRTQGARMLPSKRQAVSVGSSDDELQANRPTAGPSRAPAVSQSISAAASRSATRPATGSLPRPFDSPAFSASRRTARKSASGPALAGRATLPSVSSAGASRPAAMQPSTSTPSSSTQSGRDAGNDRADRTKAAPLFDYSSSSSSDEFPASVSALLESRRLSKPASASASPQKGRGKGTAESRAFLCSHITRILTLYVSTVPRSNARRPELARSQATARASKATSRAKTGTRRKSMISQDDAIEEPAISARVSWSPTKRPRRSSPFIPEGSVIEISSDEDQSPRRARQRPPPSQKTPVTSLKYDVDGAILLSDDDEEEQAQPSVIHPEPIVPPGEPEVQPEAGELRGSPDHDAHEDNPFELPPLSPIEVPPAPAPPSTAPIAASTPPRQLEDQLQDLDLDGGAVDDFQSWDVDEILHQDAFATEDEVEVVSQPDAEDVVNIPNDDLTTSSTPETLNEGVLQLSLSDDGLPEVEPPSTAVEKPKSPAPPSILDAESNYPDIGVGPSETVQTTTSLSANEQTSRPAVESGSEPVETDRMVVDTISDTQTMDNIIDQPPVSVAIPLPTPLSAPNVSRRTRMRCLYSSSDAIFRIKGRNRSSSQNVTDHLVSTESPSGSSSRRASSPQSALYSQRASKPDACDKPNKAASPPSGNPDSSKPSPPVVSLSSSGALMDPTPLAPSQELVPADSNTVAEDITSSPAVALPARDVATPISTMSARPSLYRSSASTVPLNLPLSAIITMASQANAGRAFIDLTLDDSDDERPLPKEAAKPPEPTQPGPVSGLDLIRSIRKSSSSAQLSAPQLQRFSPSTAPATVPVAKPEEAPSILSAQQPVVRDVPSTTSTVSDLPRPISVACVEQDDNMEPSNDHQMATTDTHLPYEGDSVPDDQARPGSSNAHLSSAAEEDEEQECLGLLTYPETPDAETVDVEMSDVESITPKRPKRRGHHLPSSFAPDILDTTHRLRRSSRHTSSASSSVGPPEVYSRAPQIEPRINDTGASEERVKTIAEIFADAGIDLLSWKKDRVRLAREFGNVHMRAKDIPHELADRINAMSSAARRAGNMQVAVFEAVISENTAEDEPRAPAIHIVNEVDHELTPPYEFYYSNLMWHGEGVPKPDHDGLRGCDCRGQCDPLNKNCSCVKRQSEHFIGSGFIYDKRGRLKEHNYPIFECNELCGCDDDCPNRVVQRGRQYAINICKTANKGWGAFLTIGFNILSNYISNRGLCRSEEDSRKYIHRYLFREYLTDTEGEERGSKYNKFGRTYLFDLDFHHLKKDDSEWQVQYCVDAYHAGNNHSCDPNCSINACYINDANMEKPLLTIFTKRDVEPYEELCFSYFGDPDEDEDEAESSQESPNKVNDAVYAPCQCGAANCRGKMWI